MSIFANFSYVIVSIFADFICSKVSTFANLLFERYNKQPNETATNNRVVKGYFVRYMVIIR